MNNLNDSVNNVGKKVTVSKLIKLLNLDIMPKASQAGHLKISQQWVSGYDAVYPLKRQWVQYEKMFVSFQNISHSLLLSFSHRYMRSIDRISDHLFGQDIKSKIYK